MSQFLYIPKRIKVGYQSRSDTYTGKLSYITYFDDKGVLRKEISWRGWRDKKIAAEEYDNVPTEGLVLHKDIKRYKWSSHFGSKRTMIRVWDPRGMEFEITTENLLGVLMHSDCVKRQLVGQFVYAWAGPELVLLPCCSEEYQAAITFTALQSGKVSAKDLVPGCGYKTKKQVDLVYVGRFHWHALKGYSSGSRETKRYHIFHRPGEDSYEDKHVWELKSNLDFLAARTTEEPVAEYAAIVEAFQKNIHSAKIVKWEVEPVEVSLKLTKGGYYAPDLDRSIYHTMKDGVITEHTVNADHESDYKDNAHVHTLLGYTVSTNSYFNVTTEALSAPPSQNSRYSWQSGYNQPKPTYLTADQLQQQGLCNLFATLDNGRRVRVESIHNL